MCSKKNCKRWFQCGECGYDLCSKCAFYMPEEHADFCKGNDEENAEEENWEGWEEAEEDQNYIEAE